jgi:hypothetical protein
MSTQEHIYIDTSERPAELAGRLADALGMSVTRGDDAEVYLSRPALDGSGNVGGELYVNDTADPDAAPEEESLLDSFPIVFDVGYTGRDREVQFREAMNVFRELVDKVPLTMAFMRGYDFLVAVHKPGQDPVWLPAKTTPYEEDRSAWLSLRPGGG